ncbi:MAG: hypothetical protein AB7P31_13650 [Steroidobacteraceae bacterium]
MTPEQFTNDLFRKLVENVLVALVLDGDYTPTFDLEKYLGAAWFEQMGRTYRCDARLILKLPTPELTERLGRAAARLFGPGSSHLPPIARRHGSR